MNKMFLMYLFYSFCKMFALKLYFSEEKFIIDTRI